MNRERLELSWNLNLYGYCPFHLFDKREFFGISKDFTYTKSVYWQYYDVVGYVGYMESVKTIFVVMRGTETKPNQDMDWDAVLTDYTTWPECNCKVHRGVDRGVNGVYPDILLEITRLREQFPDYDVQVTGHSLGGTLAQMVSMKLLRDDIRTKVIAIGGFRCGDPDFADFYNKMNTDHFRIAKY